jgi:biotin-(acetyl-CoA carboxylase) ligase
MGIGINVNQTSFESNLSATSMLIASDQEHRSVQEIQPLPIESIAISVFENLQLAWQNPIPSASRFIDHLYQRDNCVRFLELSTNEVFQAQILDVNEVGQIVVKRDDERVYAYHHGEVRMMYR